MHNVHAAADQVFRLTDRTEDGRQERNVGIDQFACAADGEQMGAERARARVERLNAPPVGRDADRTRNIVAGSFGIPAIHNAASPIFDTKNCSMAST